MLPAEGVILISSSEEGERVGNGRVRHADYLPFIIDVHGDTLVSAKGAEIQGTTMFPEDGSCFRKARYRINHTSSRKACDPARGINPGNRAPVFSKVAQVFDAAVLPAKRVTQKTIKIKTIWGVGIGDINVSVVADLTLVVQIYAADAGC